MQVVLIVEVAVEVKVEVVVDENEPVVVVQVDSLWKWLLKSSWDRCR